MELTEGIGGYTRRKFIHHFSAAVGAGVVLASPLIGNSMSFVKTEGSYTVKQVMDLFIKDVPGGALSTTVDTLKSGNGDIVVKGIVTAMFATIDVIRKAIDLGANFIISHEPTFYNHQDDTSWLKDDDVYRYKANLLDEHNIAVWRCHDYIHRMVPDGVTTAVLAQLDWQKYSNAKIPNILTIPATSVKNVVAHAKEKLFIEKVRFVGDPEQQITRVLFIPGAAGGQRQITAIDKVKPDMLICGEVSEWEAMEYVRDARAKGDKLNLAVLGHIASEEAGSEYMLNWLKKNVPAIKSTHIRSQNSYTFL